MPPLTRLFIRSGLLYLVLTFLTGILVAAGSTFSMPYPFASLNTLYFQVLMIGWVTQLIFGVANWMFPIYSREQPRGNEPLGWASYGLLNAGLLLTILYELAAVMGFDLSGWWAGIAAASMFIAGLFFVLNTWRRVKGH